MSASGPSFERAAILRSQTAACIYCAAWFAPSEITDWTDGASGQAAICPHCGIDAVAGFNGPVDPAWLADQFDQRFGRWF